VKTGFTQGASTSPLLSALALNHVGIAHHEDKVTVADDGLYFDKEGVTTPEIESTVVGVKIATNKNNG